MARVFIATENDFPLVKTAEEVEKEVASDCQQKLNMEEERIIPDPFRLDSGWLNEEDGIKYWPVTLYPDIFAFCSFTPVNWQTKTAVTTKLQRAIFIIHKDGFYPCSSTTSVEEASTAS